jgi:hypothetical protein
MEPEKDMFEQWKDERASKPWYKIAWSSISLKWNHEWKYIPKNIKQGFKNLKYWLPIIWKDRNYDHRYIYTILQHKLKSQSKYIGDRDWHTRAKRDAELMMTCVRLLDKVGDEWYSSEYSDYHKTKHWFSPYEDNEGYSTWESRQLSENFDDYFAKYPLIHKRVLNGEGPLKPEGPEDKQRIAMNIAHINEDRAHKLLFKIMERNIRGWWD